MMELRLNEEGKELREMKRKPGMEGQCMDTMVGPYTKHQFLCIEEGGERM